MTRILVVDDEPSICQTLRSVLSKSYEVDTAENGKFAIERLKRRSYDLLLTDLRMPEVDGFQLMLWAKKFQPDIEVIMITGFSDLKLAVQIVRQGAYTYITKPFKIEDIHVNIRRALEKRRADLERNELLAKQRQLEEQLLRESERRRVQEQTVVENISSLVKALEGKDTYTRGHSERVTIYARGLTRYLRLSSDLTVTIERSAKLHDIGKIGIRDSVLQKPGRLSRDEYAEIRLHPSLGADIIRPISFLHDTLEGIGHHHESYDGTGYPDRLEGRDIPFVARLLAVADTYDAMTSTRAYRIKLSRMIALNELLRCSEQPYDQDFLYNYRKRQFLEQLQFRRHQLEREFLFRNLFDSATREIWAQLLELNEDMDSDFSSILASQPEVQKNYERLSGQLDEAFRRAAECLSHPVESPLTLIGQTFGEPDDTDELAQFSRSIRKESEYCLVRLMDPRLQFDPSLVEAFVEYAQSEQELEAEIPPDFLPT